ncbi:MAG TPA: nitronate monooxygenase [Candidatus Binataceae bacterium]|nr:nitronate monooxygenase [Candidatus Binataceae bacterium]
MLHTRICDLFGIEFPIVSAGMGGVAGAELAAAVSEAGGLGTIGLAAFSREGIRNEITAAQGRTRKPLAANLLIPFLRPGIVEAVADSGLAAVTFFWGDPREYVNQISKLHSTGTKVIWQCGAVDEARMAREAGADAVMAQGFEAGGHVRGQVTTLTLVPEMRDALPEMPLIAAGGIADARGLIAALALGADGAAFGTRFLASAEAAAHRIYKDRVVRAHAQDTVHTTLFDIGWPDAPHRVLRTTVFDEWERAGRPQSGNRPGEGKEIVHLRRADVEVPLVNYSVMPPTDYTEGEIERLAFYAGQSCSMIDEILPAGEIVRRIATEATNLIANKLNALVR